MGYLVHIDSPADNDNSGIIETGTNYIGMDPSDSDNLVEEVSEYEADQDPIRNKDGNNQAQDIELDTFEINKGAEDIKDLIKGNQNGNINIEAELSVKQVEGQSNTNETDETHDEEMEDIELNFQDEDNVIGTENQIEDTDLETADQSNDTNKDITENNEAMEIVQDETDHNERQIIDKNDTNNDQIAENENVEINESQSIDSEKGKTNVEEETGKIELNFHDEESDLKKDSQIQNNDMETADKNKAEDITEDVEENIEAEEKLQYETDNNPNRVFDVNAANKDRTMENQNEDKNAAEIQAKRNESQSNDHETVSTDGEEDKRKIDISSQDEDSVGREDNQGHHNDMGKADNIQAGDIFKDVEENHEAEEIIQNETGNNQNVTNVAKSEQTLENENEENNNEGKRNKNQSIDNKETGKTDGEEESVNIDINFQDKESVEREKNLVEITDMETANNTQAKDISKDVGENHEVEEIIKGETNEYPNVNNDDKIQSIDNKITVPNALAEDLIKDEQEKNKPEDVVQYENEDIQKGVIDTDGPNDSQTMDNGKGNTNDNPADNSSSSDLNEVIEDSSINKNENIGKDDTGNSSQNIFDDKLTQDRGLDEGINKQIKDDIGQEEIDHNRENNLIKKENNDIFFDNVKDNKSKDNLIVKVINDAVDKAIMEQTMHNPNNKILNWY